MKHDQYSFCYYLMSESSSWAAHSASPIDVLFARLKPVNEAAKKAFHNVALTFVRNPDRAKSLGAAKYIHFDVSKDHAHDPINPDGIINNGSELWTGYFELCFDVPPANPHTGWTIGEGSSENNINAPDILIGTGEKLENESRSPLAILAHDQNSGALAMVVPNGKTVTLDSFEEIQGCKRLLHKAVTSIEIKSKSYKLEFQTMQNQDYRILLNGYRKSNINTSEELPSSLALVPSQFDNLIDQYVVKNAIGEGSTCTVYAGYDRTTGQVVAIKKYIRRDARSFERECGRVKMVARMDPHVRILAISIALGCKNKQVRFSRDIIEVAHETNNISQEYSSTSPPSTPWSTTPQPATPPSVSTKSTSFSNP